VSLDAPRAAQGIVWGADAYLVPKRDGSLVVGATAERAGFDCRVTAEGVRGLLGAATRLLPHLADAGFRGAWAGLRPDTPDHLPLIGPLPGFGGLVLAAGHYRNGVLLAPVTGRLVADGLLGKGWAEPAFAPVRFGPA
jgi:glycine oxidase